MSSSGSGKKDAKTGRNWGNQVCFDPQSDKDTGYVYEIDDDSLIENMIDLIDASEKIKLYGSTSAHFPSGN